MIKHISLASSSKGNSHLLSFDDGKTYIMLDCGIPFKEIKTKLFKLGIKFHQIKGVLITHEHGDHIKAAKDMSKYTRIYMTKGTYDSYSKNFINIVHITANVLFNLNGCRVMPFSVKHDATDPVNYIIKNKDEEYTFYVTDTGTLQFNLHGIKPRYIIMEANYDETEMIEKINAYEQKYKDSDETEMPDKLASQLARHYRNILSDTGHLSIEKTIKILKNQINLLKCKQITLCHVSPTNGKDDFKLRVSKALGNKITINQLKPKEVKVIEIKEEMEY